MLTEKILTLLDGVDELGNIRVKRVAQILKDGNPYGAPQYHRHVLAPGDDTTGQELHIKAMAEAVWTPEIVKARTTAEIAKINVDIALLKAKQAELDALKTKL